MKDLSHLRDTYQSLNDLGRAYHQSDKSIVAVKVRAGIKREKETIELIVKDMEESDARS